MNPRSENEIHAPGIVPLKRRSPLSIVCPLALAAAAGTLYMLTLCGGVGGKTDSAKWQFLGKVLGVPHTTGYPLYVLLNHAFSLLPFGTLAWRINFMSAFFAVLALVVLQRILRNLLDSEILALGGALVLAVAPMFWTYAVVAGVYSLNAFFICLVIYLLFKWSDVKRRGYFHAACLAYALSLGNHVTMITLFPAFVVFALVKDWRTVLSLRTLLMSLAFIIIAATLYILPFIQTAAPAPYLEHKIRTLGDLWGLVTARDFRHFMFFGSIVDLVERQVPGYLSQALAQFTLPGLLLAVAGFIVVAVRSGLKTLFLMVYLSVNLFMVLNYYAPPEQLVYQFIPSYVVLALFIGLIAGVPKAIIPEASRETSGFFAALCLLAFVALAASGAAGNLKQIEKLRSQTAANEMLADDLVDALPPNGVILAHSYGDSMIMMYKMLGDERGREKHWRVLHDTTWKTPDDSHAAANGPPYDLPVIDGLLRGDNIDWPPLAVEDRYPAGHELFFFEPDRPLIDGAGFISEPVDLPGDGHGKNIYGGEKRRIFRIVGKGGVMFKDNNAGH